MSNDKRGLFLLKGDTLYCANDGRAFDRIGVIAICKMSLSDKAADENTRPEDDYECSDKELVKEIREEVINSYKKINNRIEHGNLQNEATKAQYGRWYYEILQNMDDAIGSGNRKEFIGTKGWGFRSVLEVTDSPAVFSGPFRLHFCKEKTEMLFKEKSIPKKEKELEYTNIPTLRVPHDVEEDETVKQLKDEGYATVFRLPVRKNKIGEVKEALKNFRFAFLLFAQNIKTFRIRIEDAQEDSYTACFSVRHKRMSSIKNGIAFEKLTITRGDLQEDDVFLRWKKQWESTSEKDKLLSCMFCLPYDKKTAQCYPWKKNLPRIFNFYPTDDSIDLKAFLHITFAVSPDRKRLHLWAEDENQSTSKDEQLIEGFSSLIKNVLTSEHVPAEVALQVFSDSIQKDDSQQNVQERLRYKIWQVVRETRFVPTFGGGLVAPPEARYWGHDLIKSLKPQKSIREHHLVDERINQIKETLKKYGAKELEILGALQILKKYAKNGNLAQCQKSLKTGIAFYNDLKNEEAENILYSLPCYWTTDNQAVCLDGDYLATKEFADIPSCIELKTFHPELWKTLEDDSEALTAKLIRGKKDIAEKLLPERLKDWQQVDWKRYGWVLLKYAHEYLQEYDLVGTLWCVPTMPKDKKGSWQLAENTFFSGDWGVGKSLENWVEKKKPKERYIVAPPKDVRKSFAIQKQNDNRESLLDFFIKLGVMAHPKIIPGINTDFELEGFPDSFCKGSNYKQRCRMAERLVKQLDGNRSINVGYTNFALHQLSTYKWVTKNGSFLNSQGVFAPRECYRGTHGVFPCVSDFSSETCDTLHIKSKKQGEPYDYPKEVWEEWIEGLADNYTRFLERGDNRKEEGVNNEKVKFFYKEYFKSPHLQNISGIEVAAYPIGGIPKLQFMKKENVFWDNMSMQCDLSQLRGFKDYGLFVLNDINVDDNKRFETFGIKPVSQLFDIQLKDTPLNEKESQHILKRLEELQWKALIRVLNKSQKEYEFARLQSMLSLCTKLELHITKNEADEGKNIITTTYYCESGKAYVAINKNDRYKCDNLARFLCDIFFKTNEINNVKKTNEINNVKAILNTDTPDDLRYELEQLGIDPSEVIDEYGLREIEGDDDDPPNLPNGGKIPNVPNVPNGGRGKNWFERILRIKKPHSQAKEKKYLLAKASHNDKENKEIGKAAEKWVVNLLKREGKENVINLNDNHENNEGYDIQYQENGVTHYVEVKGSQFTWEETPRILSPRQLEMAQRKRERYWVYVVDNVSLDNSESAELAEGGRIQDPYGRMKGFVIDHSWADSDNDSSS